METLMATEAPTAAKELPSGSFVSVKNEGFEISSNTGTADEIRAELGITKEPTDGTTTPEPPADALPSKARRNDPQTRRQSIQSQIDADTARREAAKKEADAEEARLTTLREEAKRFAAPRPPQPFVPPQEQSAQPKPKDYDGADPSDPEPTLAQFAASDDPYTARLEARQDWAARKEVRKFQHQQSQLQQRGQSEQIYQRRTTALTEKLKAHEVKDPEFKTKIDPEIASALTWTTPESVGTPLGDLVMDSSNPAELMIYFSQHKQEFARIWNLHPFLQAAELGEIRGYLRGQAKASESAPPKPKPVSRASAPIKPLGGNPALPAEDTRPDDELSDEEHDARYAKMRRQFR
jgi:hypothetical protein